MAKFRFRSTDQTQVDPFSAGEPSLPWEEPEGVVGEAEPARASDPEPQPYVEPEPQPKRAEKSAQPAGAKARKRGYQAPSRPASIYDAPSTGDVPPAQPARRPFRGKRAIIIAIVLVMFGPTLLGLLFGLLSCTADIVFSVGDAIVELVDEGDNDVSLDIGWDLLPEPDGSDSSGDPLGLLGDEERAVAEAFEARLTELLADPASGELHDRLASYLDEQVLSLAGCDAAGLGIDRDAWATWYLEQVDWSVEGATAWDDGTALAQADLQEPWESSFWLMGENGAWVMDESDLFDTLDLALCLY